MKTIMTWFEKWEIEKTVFRLMLKGVIVLAFIMAGFDWLFYSSTLAFLELSFACVSSALLYFTLNNTLRYNFSARTFILAMALPVSWNLLYNESPIESTVLFIFLPIITGILRPVKEVLLFSMLFGGSFLYITMLGIGEVNFTYMEVFKLVSTQVLISFFVIIYVQMNRRYQKVIMKQSKALQDANINLERLYKEKEAEASTDSLTGLKNRAALMTQLEYLYARYKRQKEVFSLIIMDIDKFKYVNDNYGHQKGDEVLQNIAGITLECIREVDTSARYGGEEFVILLPQTNRISAMHIAERIRESIEYNIVIEGRHITSSFGVVEIEEEYTITDLIKKADDALYKAKGTGRNKVVCAQEE
ncbi:GGDEF domain-containing protein [Sulfurimonas sp. MAG313]|nr:GGDEF domain-containing protein [Sulfurimonas sp. MAG313]MDF1880794.1 GGDEF domain-containing protein [Sulfurimonas sp. MAG313]